MIEVIITKGRGSENKDTEIFNNITGITKTAFGKNGILPLPERMIKVLMVRKKHFHGHYTDVRILIDPEHNVTLEKRIEIEKYFTKMNMGANFDVIAEIPEKKFCTTF